MRFYRAKIILVISVLVVGFFSNPAKADNANPPKIIELVQVTKGPYKPGDLITIKVVYTGGNPGLSRVLITFSGNCFQAFDWNESDGITEKHGNGIFSSPVPTCPPGIYKFMTSYIKDKTGLSNIMYADVSNIQVEISDFAYKPVKIGEIAPSTLQTHKVDISLIPLNPKLGESFLLPAITSVGMPVYYNVVGDTNICTINQERFGTQVMPGGTLKIAGFGKCQLSISADNGTRFSSQRPTYSQPIIESKVPIKTSSNSGLATFEILDATKSTQKSSILVCKKGKTIKQVKGINPTCPKGFRPK
jgi:hypothetical protein